MNITVSVFDEYYTAKTKRIEDKFAALGKQMLNFISTANRKHEEQIRKLALLYSPECKNFTLENVNSMFIPGAKCASLAQSGGYTSEMHCAVDALVRAKGSGALSEYIKPDVNSKMSGVNSSVYMSDMNNVSLEKASDTLSKPFIVKTCYEINKTQHDEQPSFSLTEKSVIYHEANVAFYGTNTLRSVVPNFAYIYGIKECSTVSPFNKSDKEGTQWCKGEGASLPHLIYEAIHGQTLPDMDPTETEMHEISLQLFLALQLANERFKFSHQDLHSRNYIIKTLEKPCYVVYPLNTGNVYIYVRKYVPVIIDYGSSTIEIYGKIYGDPRPLDLYGIVTIENEFVRPLADAFRVVTEIYNYKYYPIVEKLIWFFNKTESHQTLSGGVNKWYMSLPSTDEVRNTTLLDFISYYHETLGEKSPITYDPDPNIPIYGRQESNVNFSTIMGLDSPQAIKPGSTIGKYLLLDQEGLPYNLPEEANHEEIIPYNIDTDYLKDGLYNIQRISESYPYPKFMHINLSMYSVSMINWYENLKVQHDALSLYQNQGIHSKTYALRNVYGEYLKTYEKWYNFAKAVWDYETTFDSDMSNTNDIHKSFQRLYAKYLKVKDSIQ